jgi:hypothetical protein
MGRSQQRFATDEGELGLSIFERGMSARFRWSGLPIDIGRVETMREDGGRQLFRFENCGTYWLRALAFAPPSSPEYQNGQHVMLAQ